MVDSQPMEEEFQGATTRDEGTKTHEGPTEPVLQTQKTPSPSPAFIKENIDVLRTMIKEHDQEAKIKPTPRKLAYADSDKEALASCVENLEAAFEHSGKILGGDQLLVILCGYGTKSLELRTSFLSMTMFVALDRGTRSVSIVILSFKNASMYNSQLICPALFCYSIVDSKEEPIEEEPLEEPNEKVKSFMEKDILKTDLGRDMDTLSLRLCLLGGSRGSFEVGVGAAEEGKVVCLVFQIEAMTINSNLLTPLGDKSFLGLAQRTRQQNAALACIRLMERKECEGMYLLWVPLIGDVRTLMMDEAHASRTWWKIYFATLVYIAEGIENTAKNMRTTYHPQTDGQIIIRVFDVLYLKRCMEGSVGHMFFRLKLEKFGRLVQETTNKVILIKEKLKAARDCQKSYVSNMQEIKVDKTLHFVEEPVEIIDREVKSLKRSRIPIVKSIGTRSKVMRIS
ncbi:hypothetical protein Tco_1033315 [Tanacetum coccineum]|uniref:Uncharacterized protein n=1 Tax=Tanacetum coccineum TaxID=301880 RepID=A0ABQ5GFZ6_9ASTR